MTRLKLCCSALLLVISAGCSDGSLTPEPGVVSPQPVPELCRIFDFEPQMASLHDAGGGNVRVLGQFPAAKDVEIAVLNLDDPTSEVRALVQPDDSFEALLPGALTDRFRLIQWRSCGERRPIDLTTESGSTVEAQPMIPSCVGQDGTLQTECGPAVVGEPCTTEFTLTNDCADPITFEGATFRYQLPEMSVDPMSPIAPGGTGSLSVRVVAQSVGTLEELVGVDLRVGSEAGHLDISLMAKGFEGEGGEGGGGGTSPPSSP